MNKTKLTEEELNILDEVNDILEDFIKKCLKKKKEAGIPDDWELKNVEETGQKDGNYIFTITWKEPEERE